jgi:hypothetical protein
MYAVPEQAAALAAIREAERRKVRAIYYSKKVTQ